MDIYKKYYDMWSLQWGVEDRELRFSIGKVKFRVERDGLQGGDSFMAVI